MRRHEVLVGVTDVLVDALGVEKEEIKREVSLIEDLGAESIDFLDIIFRLEKNFDIKIPDGDLFPGHELFTDERFVKDEKVTEEGLEELKKRMPNADLERIVKDPDVRNVRHLFTVEMVVLYIEKKVSEVQVV